MFNMLRTYDEKGSIGKIPGANLLDEDSHVIEETMIAQKSFKKLWMDDGSTESSVASSPLDRDNSQVVDSSVVNDTTFDAAPLQTYDAPL